MSEMILEGPESGEGAAVYESPAEEAAAALKERFPEGVADDSRTGFEGLIVSADKIVEVAQTLRDELGFDYLTSLTGVDLIEEDKMEVVYHACSIEKQGVPLVLKVQVNREDAVVP